MPLLYAAKRVMIVKSVGRKIVFTNILTVGASLLFLGIAAVTITYYSMISSVQSNMTQMTKIAAKRTQWEMQAYSNIAAGLGGIADLSDPEVSAEDKKTILTQWAERYSLERCNLIDAEGNGIDGNTYSDRAYYKNAMNGKASISEPLVSKVTGKLTIIVAAPLIVDGSPAGCVYVVPNEEFLNDIMRSIEVSENSTAYMLDKDGNIIADVNMDTVKNGYSFDEKDSGYKAITDMQAKMTAGESGSAKYVYGGQWTVAAYHPIEGTNDWSLAVVAPRSDFMANTNTAFMITILITIAALLISSAFAVRMGNKIGKPIKLMTTRIDALAAGDLTGPVPNIKTGDETEILAEAASAMLLTLTNIINDIGRVLGEISKGDLNVDTKECGNYYSGDFSQIITYMDDIIRNLDKTIANINKAADQVSAGASQVSSAAQNLSDGTSEQASSIEELAATIHEISDQVSENSRNCADASAFVNETAEYVDGANKEMALLTEAMNNISSTSDQIGNIISSIEDIAFQTNILALNAAVEAARAGEAGKGFAVVADEVRNLASKSAEAAKDTTLLIEQSMDAVNKGMSIAEATAAAMANVGKKTVSIEGLVGKIAEASGHQAEKIEQINVGVDQISSVVQTNSATAEESASASEQLSSQAAMLKGLINMFTLKSR